MFEFEIKFYNNTMDKFYSISPCVENKIWIQAHDGEGGSFDADLIYNLIHQNFKDNF